jgi:hypothetical protein
MSRWLVLAVVIAACGSDPPPPVVVVPPQPPPPATEEPAPPPAPIAIATPPAEPPPNGSPLEPLLRTWSDKENCGAFDYHPNGGIQSFWCHKPTTLSYVQVISMAGVDVFQSGPHANGELHLDSTKDFGHYNPAFVQWLVEKAGPSPRDSSAQKLTQAAYDKHLKPLATIFWKTLEKSRSEADCFNREKTAYADLIAKKKLPKDYYERWFYFMNPKYCAKAKTGLGKDDGFQYFVDNGMDGGVDGNVTKTVVGFWLRRSIDGTMDQFAAGLKKLLESYDPGLVKK